VHSAFFMIPASAWGPRCWLQQCAVHAIRSTEGGVATGLLEIAPRGVGLIVHLMRSRCFRKRGTRRSSTDPGDACLEALLLTLRTGTLGGWRRLWWRAIRRL
jgi:hypothetical protein